MKDVNLLFVYGTLLSEAQNEFSDYLIKHSTPVGSGWLNGELFLINWYPGLVLSDDPKNKVFGQVVRLNSNPTEVLKRLDAYEGVNYPPKSSDEYVRKAVKIMCLGKPLKCWAYLFVGEIKGLEKIESGDFINFQKGKQH